MRLVGVEVAGPLHDPPVSVGEVTGVTGEELVVELGDVGGDRVRVDSRPQVG